MNISAISMANRTMNFAGKNTKKADSEAKPIINLGKSVPDDAVVTWCTWGGNYAFPVTAGQMREQQAKAAAAKTKEAQTVTDRETPEEYYKRKLYSPEWAG